MKQHVVAVVGCGRIASSAHFPALNKIDEVRIMVRPEEVSDQQMILVAHDIVKKIEEELKYPGQIKIHMVRESRVIDYAK